MKSVIIDLDGTLCDTAHRDHLAEQKRWDDFHAVLHEDTAHEDVLHLIDHLYGNFGIVLLTARPERYRQVTTNWLNLFGVKWDVLIMRKDDDFSSSDEFKIKALEHWFGGDKALVLDQVLFCLEDRTKNVQAFRNYGLPCWQVREGSY